MKQQRRKAVVFFALAGVLSGTTGLLLALSPRPLMPGTTLLSAETASGLDVIFDTPTRPTAARWNAIYIHHTATPAGNAYTNADPAAGPGDHFVIGNGDGAEDGEIQLGTRWTQQVPALPPPGASQLDPHCVSISVVGDFENSQPTDRQADRLGALVSTLQARLHIPAGRVYVRPEIASAAGAGKYFPVAEFEGRLRP